MIRYSSFPQIALFFRFIPLQIVGVYSFLNELRIHETLSSSPFLWSCLCCCCYFVLVHGNVTSNLCETQLTFFFLKCIDCSSTWKEKKCGFFIHATCYCILACFIFITVELQYHHYYAAAIFSLLHRRVLEHCRILFEGKNTNLFLFQKGQKT